MMEENPKTGRNTFILSNLRGALGSETGKYDLGKAADSTHTDVPVEIIDGAQPNKNGAHKEEIVNFVN